MNTETVFHGYGLIIGLALVIGWQLAEYQLHRHQAHFKYLNKIGLFLFICGLAGARIWHVMTEWPYYRAHLLQVGLVWDGGLSILGAIGGGVLGLGLGLRWKWLTRLQAVSILDATALSLPFAQAIGRWGNYLNQELYGLPSHLPWAIYIDPIHRMSGYENIQYYHPLFLYESSLLIVFAFLMWGWDWYQQQRQKARFGTGNYFLIYMSYYCLIRFGLDFLRIDKRMFFDTWLGVNQVVLLGVFVGCWVMFQKKKSKKFKD